MRYTTPALASAAICILFLSACGGGSGGNGPPVNNPAPTATLSANPTSISQGGSSTLTWSSTNATSCNAAGGTFAGAKGASGSELVTNIQAPTTYSLVCSGAGGNSPTTTASVAVSAVSTANAGVSRTVPAGAPVRLSGEASFDPEGDPLQYTWTQTGGAPTVTLTGANTANPTFTAPAVASSTALTFSLSVSDGSGTSGASVVVITVAPIAAGNVLVTGRVTFVRIPFSTNTNFGLNYTLPVNRAARGVVVRANNAGMQTQVAIGETDSDGNYALSVPQNTSIDVYAVARMSRDNSVPLPRWSYQVSDVDAAAAPYTFTDSAFNSATGAVAHNLSIPSGYNTSGAVIGTRASAPFAVLDTIYTATQAVLGVAPVTNFPVLGVDWATNNPGGQTFFDSGTQRIVLSADVDEDTDEFDQHVIAHEFGHYIEFNFSRADNIGGSHGLGDKLDIRVAFGEGFGYAFAGIVLKDPVARDSFVGGGCGAPLCSSTFNIETNPPLTGNGGDFGCWCSESSVWSTLWDLYDSNADSNDNIALGFQPLWGVLIGEQRTTPAMTSIFSFMTALKIAQPGRANAIDALLGGQNITTAGLDAYGSTETHVPSPVSSAGALPVYATVSNGGQVSVLSVNDAGHYNTLGNHRFIRYNKSGTATQTVTVTNAAANSDPDAIVYLNGEFLSIREAQGNETFTISASGTYIFDVYECANGCGTIEGTAGDYTVTLAIN